MAKRQKLERITTPQGVAYYPHLDKPDEYKGQRKYKCGLILDGDDPFVQNIRDRADAAFEDAKEKLQEQIDSGTLKGKKLAAAKAELEAVEVHYPFEDEYNDEGEPTGNIIVKTVSNAEFKDSKGNVRPIKLNIFDSQGNQIKPCPAIWGGSVLRLAVDVNPYHMPATHLAGISLRLSGVQIIELESGSGASAESMGFGAVDGGYVAPEKDDDDESPFGDEGEDGEDDDEF